MARTLPLTLSTASMAICDALRLLGEADPSDLERIRLATRSDKCIHGAFHALRHPENLMTVQGMRQVCQFFEEWSRIGYWDCTPNTQLLIAASVLALRSDYSISRDAVRTSAIGVISTVGQTSEAHVGIAATLVALIATKLESTGDADAIRALRIIRLGCSVRQVTFDGASLEIDAERRRQHFGLQPAAIPAAAIAGIASTTIGHSLGQASDQAGLNLAIKMMVARLRSMDLLQNSELGRGPIA